MEVTPNPPAAGVVLPNAEGFCVFPKALVVLNPVAEAGRDPKIPPVAVGAVEPNADGVLDDAADTKSNIVGRVPQS